MQEIDNAIVLWVQTLRCPTGDTITKILAVLGYCWFAVPFVYFLIKKRWKAAIVTASVFFLNVLIGNILLKGIVERVRPFRVLGFDPVTVPPDEFSFPSCHSMQSFAAASSVWYYTRKTEPAIAWGSIAWASLIALSRLYNGVHYLTDLLAGAAIGVAISVAVIVIVSAVDKKKKMKERK